MSALFAAATAFFLLHLLPSTKLRGRTVAIAGEGPYLAVFSLLSLITIWWLARAFVAAPYGEKLWLAPQWWPWLQAAFILFAFVLIVGGGASPNPSLPGGARLLDNPNAVAGIYAITRHPIMWGVGIWALTHIISQPTERGLLFFGAFAATALIGIWLQERRKRRALAAWPAFTAKTSFFPFMSLLEGRSKLSLQALGWWRLLMAMLLWAAFLYFHVWLFGVRPLQLGA